jgi:hypothetical protein
MKRILIALIAGVSLLLAIGVGVATASPPSTQTTGQSATSSQDALALAGTAQIDPSNTNVSVRVLSPGDDGSVTQSNDASSTATAANENTTTQSAEQNLADTALQSVGQDAKSWQTAGALAGTLQHGSSNDNVGVRVLSPGDSGSVEQANNASSQAAAGNTNATGQSAVQNPGSACCESTDSSERPIGPKADDGCCGGDGTQTVGQSADSSQAASAGAATFQENPSNTNVSVRVLSEGDDGDVAQSNDASSTATAANANRTQQSADQSQTGGSCCGGKGGSQAVGQSSSTDQQSEAASLTGQKDARNTNVSVRVLSPGDGGSVSQANRASSDAKAGNTNTTSQTADQTQSQAGNRCCGGSSSQAIGQSASSSQEARALGATLQGGASNTNAPVRVQSDGDNGDVDQSNDASSTASAGNTNTTQQTADQDQGGGTCCGGVGIQAIGQKADTDQHAGAAALTAQIGASNTNAPVRVQSDGDNGDVDQSNDASSTASAGNTNTTQQTADQDQGGDTCCGGVGIQAIGQLASNRQGAFALSATLQAWMPERCGCDPRAAGGNSHAPVRTASHGDDGEVSQSNGASSDAKAGNTNETPQTAAQRGRPGCGCNGLPAIQAAGQSSWSLQFTAVLAAAAQLGAHQHASPARNHSPGYGGSLSQAGSTIATSTGGNRNATGQGTRQLR